MEEHRPKNSPNKARKTPEREWETKKRIGSRITNRLLRHIFADPNPEPEPEADPEAPPKKRKKPDIMTGDQVHAALGLLRKYMPDLKAIELTGNPTKPVVQRIERVIVDPKPPNPESIPAAADPESL